MKAKVEPIRVWHAVKRSVISIIFLIIIIFLMNIAPNYVKESKLNQTRLIINCNDITRFLKSEVICRDEEYYISADDYKNFFDEFLIEDSDNIITTSNTKTVRISRFRQKMYINGSNVDVTYKPITENNKTFLSLSEMSKIYGFEYNIVKDRDTIMISSLNKKLVQATSSKKLSLKYEPTAFSRTLEKINRGDIVTIVQNNSNDGNVKIGSYVKVLTSSGRMGYVKENKLINQTVVRENLNYNELNGKVKLAWDYYSPYTAVPNRTDSIEGINAISPSFFELKKDGSVSKNYTKKYVEWAHNNNYKVWPTFSNSFLNNLDAVSKMMESFDSRSKLIENIVNAVVETDVDGVNIDFENMYKEDKDKFSRFIIELEPRLRDLGKVLLVDVTVPDGSDTWSLCYDRYTLGKACDYLVFIGYDQHNASSKEAGSVSGYDWVEANLKKFLGQEGVASNKLVLAMPFYTRLWSEKDENVSSDVVNMKNIKIPQNVTARWDEITKQNYYEYQNNGVTYKMWMEDEQSISEKINLVNQYNLAGAGFWEKDRETPGVWNIVKEKLGN